MSRCTRAGSKHSPAANPSWPVEILHRCHAQYINECWPRGKNLFLEFDFSVSSAKSASSAVIARGLAVQWVIVL